MGRYIVESDIQARFGIDNVNTWADLDNDDVPDAGRVDASIAYAEDRIDDFFRDGRYAIPFAFRGVISQTLKNWAAVLAGWWLYTSRGMRDEEAGERIRVLVEGDDGTGGVEADMRSLAAGVLRFNAKQSNSQPSAPTVV